MLSSTFLRGGEKGQEKTTERELATVYTGASPNTFLLSCNNRMRATLEPRGGLIF